VLPGEGVVAEKKQVRPWRGSPPIGGVCGVADGAGPPQAGWRCIRSLEL